MTLAFSSRIAWTTGIIRSLYLDSSPLRPIKIYKYNSISLENQSGLDKRFANTMQNLLRLCRYLLYCTLLCILTSRNRVVGTKLLTYNAFMIPRAEKYIERKALFLDNLKNTDSDVVCLQEIFYGKDVIDVKEQLKTLYPYSYSAMHQNDVIKPGPPCLASDLPVLACIQSNGCLNAATESEQLQCGIIKCSAFQKLSQNCLTCIIISGSNATYLQNNCIMSAIDFNTDGLILLSKNPMTAAQRVEYHPGIVKNIGLVRCTHLVAYDIPRYIEPNMPYTSFYEQIEVEVKQLLKDTCQENKVIIMGDFNIGPSIPSHGVAGLYESNSCLFYNHIIKTDFQQIFNHIKLHDLYMEFIRRDFTSPYVDLVGKCTYCDRENSLVSIWPTDKLIDFVLIKGYKAKNAKRLFDTAPLASDHYGVEISI
ncbi:hypothetical protein KUTeg_015001 [Tegillarca granosa]|uniref:Endonuclease/exonuclease/phosphatase domain-containing protein n=1 Tax=Tegillarca granosa TaxID=220873 RepID=A0ABQ9ESJ4_TEGGR|nr:hypothetical protein KUTeg_015001 [Tegillarca granosa]